MAQESNFCTKCGAALPPASSFCPKCGAPVQAAASSSPSDWREQRRQWRAQRRAERHGPLASVVAPLVLATILVVAGLAIFFPDLPLQWFWGSLLILLGLWVFGAWTMRSRRPPAPQQPQ